MVQGGGWYNSSTLKAGRSASRAGVLDRSMGVKNLGESWHWGLSEGYSSVGRWDSISRIWVSEAPSITEQAEISSFNSFHEDRNINRMNSGIHGTFMLSLTTIFKSFNAGKESRDMSGMNTSLLDSISRRKWIRS